MCRTIATPEHRPQIADIKRMLNIVEPMIVPRPISPSPMNTDAIAMNRVGMELPAAMNVAPATSVGMRSLWKTKRHILNRSLLWLMSRIKPKSFQIQIRFIFGLLLRP